MSVIKQVKDYLIKILWDGKSVPRELLELNEYFRNYGAIHFEEKEESGEFITISKDFKYGSIITSGKTREELDKNVEDAILTSFEIPSSYRKEANLHKVGQKNHSYAIA